MKPAFHDTNTNILSEILARIVARMSVSVSWNAARSNRWNFLAKRLNRVRVIAMTVWHTCGTLNVWQKMPTSLLTP